MKMRKKVREKSKVDSSPRLITGVKVTGSGALIVHRRVQNVVVGARQRALRKQEFQPDAKSRSDAVTGKSP